MVRKPTYKELEETVNRLVGQLDEKYSENSNLKREFLSMISHEIRTPLHAIMGFVQLMAKANLSKEEKDEYISLITQSGLQLLSVMDTLIDASLLDSGDLRLNPTECNLPIFFDEMHGRFSMEKHKLDRNNIALLKNVDLAPNAKVIFADTYRLEQIFTHLLNNALIHTQKGVIEFGCLMENQSQIRFFVNDSGGKPVEKLFGVIKNLNLETNKSRMDNNAGLGLSISRDLVGLMGGRIWIEGNDYQGTSVCFSIPVEFMEENTKDEYDYLEQSVKKNIA